jgi:hypothetical protein
MRLWVAGLLLVASNINVNVNAFTTATDTSYISRACSIYCHGPVLEAIQMSFIYNDSKTFVDMPMM